MGTVSRGAYQPTLVAENQPNFPQIADRTAIMGGAIILDMANNQAPEVFPVRRMSQPLIIATDNKSAYGSNYGDSFIFERIWVQPLEIDVGFIVEDSQWYIQVWNASRFDPASVTDISVFNPDGTQLTYDALPNVMPIFGDVNYLLEVFNIGPPLQDTIYRFTVEGLDYDSHITGIRVLPFDLDPNWDTGIRIGYNFQTTIFKSKRLNEQRRPLGDDSWFSTAFKADASGNQSRINFNQISYGKDKVFGVPVFTEKIEPTSLAQGGTSIYTNDDLTKMYNLCCRTDFVILVDHINGLSEVKKIDSLDVGLINLEQPISDDFQQETTYVYPCMFCYLNSYRAGNITTDMNEVSVNFEEYKS